MLLCLISNCRCFCTNNIGKYHAQRLLCLSPNFLRYYCCTKYLVTASLNVCHNSFKEMFLTRPSKFDFARCLGVLAFSVVLKYTRCTCYSRGTRQIYWKLKNFFFRDMVNLSRHLQSKKHGWCKGEAAASRLSFNLNEPRKILSPSKRQ